MHRQHGHRNLHGNQYFDSPRPSSLQSRGRRRSLTQSTRLRLLPKQLVSTEKRRNIVITFAWGLSIAWIYAHALYTYSGLSDIDLFLACAVCVLAGIILGDFATAFLGFIAALAIGVVMTVLLYTLALVLWPLSTANSIILGPLFLTVLFNSFIIVRFPFLFYFAASIAGSAIGEKYLT